MLRIPKLALSIAVLFAATHFATAQFVDHLIDSAFTNAAALDSLSIGESSALQLVPAGWESALSASRLYYLGGATTADKDGKTVAMPVPFLESAIFSVQYGYSQIDGSLPGHGYGTRGDINSGSPDLFLESTSGLFIDLSYSYSDNSRTNNYTDARRNYSHATYSNSVSALAAQDLLRLFKLKSKDTLALALGFNYANENDTLIDPRRHLVSNYQNYSLTPRLIYVHPFTNRFAATLEATYECSWVRSDYNEGIAAVLGRADYKVTKDVTAYVSASWNHTISNTGGDDIDYGVFGAGVRWDCCRSLGLAAGYDYVAFDPITVEHSTFIRAEYHF